jgi:hypothetical protein
MKRWFGFILAFFLFTAGCGTGSKVPVLSSTLSEDETKTRVRDLPVMKLESASGDEKAAQEAGRTEREKVRLGETTPVKETAQPGPPLTIKDHTVEALIELLQKKGIISKKELLEEMQMLKQRSQ